uniref:Ribonuclease H-like domain-containing protein n=1 Tax=Tanacetum cinerariifolium TaxID=118510 RepID=A0A6L2JSW5_TANCI|nr:ribonuclease H-like domain-containing protein [Tanacetum cinerariifolium]
MDHLLEVKDAYTIIFGVKSHRGITESSGVSESKLNASSFAAKTFNGNRRPFNNISKNNNTRGSSSTSNVNRGPNPNLNCKNYDKIDHIIEIIGFPPRLKRNANIGKHSFNDAKLLSLINDNSSGSIHANMTCRASFFNVGHPNGTLATISHVGNLKLSNNVILYDVLVIPEYCVSLLSVNKLIRNSKTYVGFDEDMCYSQDLKKKKFLGTGSELGGLYLYDMVRDYYVGKSNMVTQFHVSKLIWHIRLGHPSSQVLSVLHNDLDISKSSSIPVCEACHRAKQTMDPFSLSNHKYKTHGELVYLDLAVWVYLVKTKDEVFDVLVSFRNLLNSQFEVKLKIVRFDNSTEFEHLSFFDNQMSQNPYDEGRATSVVDGSVPSSTHDTSDTTIPMYQEENTTTQFDDESSSDGNISDNNFGPAQNVNFFSDGVSLGPKTIAHSSEINLLLFRVITPPSTSIFSIPLLNTPPSFDLCLGDLSRLILENTLGLGLGLRERLDLFLFSCSLAITVFDSEYRDVSEHPLKAASDEGPSRSCVTGSFPLPTMFRTSDVGWLGADYSGLLMVSIFVERSRFGSTDGANLRIQVKDIVKKVEDYLKTYSSAEMDISLINIKIKLKPVNKYEFDKSSEQLAELFTKDSDSDVKEDNRTNDEFMANLIVEYHERPQLENFKRDSTKEDEPSVGKGDARSGQWVDITVKKDYLKRFIWYLDSGCSKHMTGVKQYMHRYSKEYGPKEVFGDNSSSDTEGYSSVNYNGITFIRVTDVNGLKHNLISISQLCDANFKVLFTKTQRTIFNEKDEVVLISPRRRDVYVIDISSYNIDSNACFYAKASPSVNCL